MNAAAAAELLDRHEAFWRVRARFFFLAFGLAGDDSRAAEKIGAAEELLALNPTKARGLWDRALAEVGGITRDAAIELSRLGAAERLRQVDRALRALGMTAAGVARFSAPFAEVESGAPPGFWRWVEDSEIAGGSPR